MRHFWKYDNKKLYDIDNSRYASLDDISACVLNGEDLQILDYTSGRCITTEVLIRAYSKMMTPDKINQNTLTALIKTMGAL